MATLKKIIKLTKAQYNTLAGGGTVGSFTGLSDDYLYMVEGDLSVATANNLGVVKLGSDTQQTISANSVSATADRTYAIQLNNNNQMVVNVPWTNSKTITANATDGIFDLTGTNGTDSVTYSLAPYSSTAATSTWVSTDGNAGKFYLGTQNPAKTTRLNYNGYLYATKLYSGTKEVLTAHPTISTSADTTSTGTLSHSGTFTAITSVTRDSNGHVTTINTKTYTLPSDSNTDTKVSQSATTTDSWRKLLMHYDTGASSTAAVTTATNGVYGAVGISAQPSTGTIRATKYNIADGCTLEFNSTLKTVNFVFA